MDAEMTDTTIEYDPESEIEKKKEQTQSQPDKEEIENEKIQTDDLSHERMSLYWRQTTLLQQSKRMMLKLPNKCYWYD